MLFFLVFLARIFRRAGSLHVEPQENERSILRHNPPKYIFIGERLANDWRALCGQLANDWRAIGGRLADVRRAYVLTYNNIMLRHINAKKLYMSILYCTFAIEIKRVTTLLSPWPGLVM